MEDDAIILNRIEVGESDIILTLLSRRHGNVSAIAKGGRRSKKRFVNKLEPFTLLTIDYSHYNRSSRKGRKSSGLAFLHEAELHTIFPRLRREYRAYLAGSMLMEFLLYGLQEEEQDSALFSLLLWALQRLDYGEPADTTVLFFLLRAYECIGYRPELQACSLCNTEVHGRALYSFHNAYGGLLCSSCINQNMQKKDSNINRVAPLSIAAIKTLQVAQNMPLARLHSLHLDARCRREALNLLYGFGRHLLQRDYNSWRDFIAVCE